MIEPCFEVQEPRFDADLQESWEGVFHLPKFKQQKHKMLLWKHVKKRAHKES